MVVHCAKATVHPPQSEDRHPRSNGQSPSENGLLTEALVVRLVDCLCFAHWLTAMGQSIVHAQGCMVEPRSSEDPSIHSWDF